MRILVTGSEGVLGTKLVRELKEKGHQVFGCDLWHTGKENYQRADVGEWRQIEQWFRVVQPELCYHLAGEFGRKNGQEYTEQLWKSNVIGTHNLIELCVRHGTHLAFASSSEAYGGGFPGELKEELLETQRPSFHNEYALSKYTNEHQIDLAIRTRGLRATVFRFFNVYGPGEYYTPYRSVVCLFIYKMLKRESLTVYGNTRRSFLYVDDWARTMVNLSRVVKIIKNGLTFNLGSTEYVSMSDLVGMLEQRLGPAIKIVKELEENNVADKIANVEWARSLLAHKETVRLVEGLDKTIEWMRNEYE